jgi:hypothetical protein
VPQAAEELVLGRGLHVYVCRGGTLWGWHPAGGCTEAGVGTGRSNPRVHHGVTPPQYVMCVLRCVAAMLRCGLLFSRPPQAPGCRS